MENSNGDVHLKKNVNWIQQNLNCQLSMRKSSTFCDAVILLEDGGSIPVHRIVLCTASEYFQ